MAEQKINYFDRLDLKKTVEDVSDTPTFLGAGNLFKGMIARAKSINHIVRVPRTEEEKPKDE